MYRTTKYYLWKKCLYACKWVLNSILWSLPLFYTALKKFSTDDHWETDMNSNIAMVKWNIEEELNEIGFDSTGFMGNFTFEGIQFEKTYPDK